MKKVISQLIFLLLIGNLAYSQTTDYSKQGQYQTDIIEFRELTDASRNNRNVPVKVHYPLGSGIFPVVVVSHGAGGSWDGHYGLAHFLASHGFIVLCLEHVGSNTVVLKKSFRFMDNIRKMVYDSNEVLARPKDVSFAIDQLSRWNVSNPKLRNHIDIQNIGVIGHSFGAYTSMAIAGIRPALDYIKPTVPPGKGVGPDLSDNCVKACVALSPQGDVPPFFIPESFSTLKIPLMGMSGTKDQLLGGIEPVNRYKSFDLWPKNKGENKFVWLQNATHMDFSDSEGSGTVARFSANRPDVSRIVRASALIFFNYHLKGDKVAIQSLTTNGLSLYLSKSIDGVEVRSK